MSLRDFEGKRIVIWPSYFLASSRNKGRRFKLINGITIEDIINVCKRLNLDPIIIENKKYPREKSYNFIIVVNKVKNKRYTLKMIFNELVKIKQQL
jgi:signal recognition particle subunit SRP19